jgi:hypothetical protein
MPIYTAAKSPWNFPVCRCGCNEGEYILTKHMKIKLNKVAKLGLVALVIAAFGANFAFAGGSCYSFGFEGKTSFAAPGTTVYDVQKIDIETYFRSPPNAKINARAMQVRIDKVKVSCYGDDVIKSANLRVGSHSYGTADFVKIPNTLNLYEASIQPKLMVLLNNSYYSAGLDLITDAKMGATRLATCDITEIVHKVADRPGAEFTDRSGSGNMGPNSPSVIIVGNRDRYDANLIGDNFDLKRPVTGYMHGSIKAAPEGRQLFKVGAYNWEKNRFSSIMMPYNKETAVNFEILRLQPFPADQLNHTTAFGIQELHVYDTPGANGSAGSIVLTDYNR